MPIHETQHFSCEHKGYRVTPKIYPHEDRKPSRRLPKVKLYWRYWSSDKLNFIYPFRCYLDLLEDPYPKRILPAFGFPKIPEDFPSGKQPVVFKLQKKCRGIPIAIYDLYKIWDLWLLRYTAMGSPWSMMIADLSPYTILLLLVVDSNNLMLGPLL